MDELLKIQGLELKLNGSPVLFGLDFFIGEGEIVGLVGENGSGKTMTLRSIAGLEQPNVDELKFLGASLAGLPVHGRVERGLSYCPSEDNVFPRMSVLENLEMGSYLFPERESRGLDRVYRLFPALEERKEQMATTLSGGERQMLALGKALMSRPELLLLDEFSLGLSQENAIEFSEKIKEVHASGVSVLFVEQNQALAVKLAERIYRMVEGRITEEYQFGLRGAPEGDG